MINCAILKDHKHNGLKNKKENKIIMKSLSQQ
jgi:hypothetical protein